MPGLGVHCEAIMESRHVDVLEMDAASHTGIEDVRQIIDGIRYSPASARYKVYIIDEVHMLSEKAFNAFLKTLEEPPPHAKFVFATTEIRKVPVTILSRCQRFDLRRIEADKLVAHLAASATPRGCGPTGRRSPPSPARPRARRAIRSRSSTRPSPTGPGRDPRHGARHARGSPTGAQGDRPVRGGDARATSGAFASLRASTTPAPTRR
jgi:hypothetical protein